MSDQQWPKFALRSFAALAGAVYIGFGMSFNPGWMNGWPFGITIHAVFSTVMSGLSFSVLMTSSAFVASLIATCLAAIGVGDRYLRPAFVLWMICCLVPAAILTQICFTRVYASTFEMWPDGYPVGR